MDFTEPAIDSGATAARPGVDPASGTRAGSTLVGRFKLLEEIGHGGMGAVWSARDTLMQGEPLIAIKLLGDDFLKKRVKVLDFGVARAIRSKEDLESQSRLYETAMPGFLTLSYASSEMIEGLEPDPRDDVYALACVTCAPRMPAPPGRLKPVRLDGRRPIRESGGRANQLQQ